MDKLKLHSPDITQQNIDKIRAMFPGCVTESLDANGKLKLAVDFDQLRQELSGSIVEGPQERYQLNWPGKREAMLAANAPIAKTLRPCREESVDFDSTKNLFIEGDNLDALKLLQETYLGKVKMIYIDPPYNTGNDFIYKDDFSESSTEYLHRSNQVDMDGNRLLVNKEGNGRFHSEWLSMIHSRVRLAKNLLSIDGVIFISIDDVEISNLRKICDEIFGEEQFAAQIIWKKKNTPPNDKVIGAQHDYILVYVKDSLEAISLRPRSAAQLARYKNLGGHPKGEWVSGDLTANVKGGRYVESLNYPIKNPRTAIEYFPPNNGNWRFNKEKVEALIENDEIYFGAKDDSTPKVKRFLCDVKDGVSWTTLWDFAPLNTSGSKEMSQIFGSSILFENPKPVGLLKYIIEAGTSGEGLVLDFFAGSATTAHAVYEANSKDGGSRKCITVQIDESTGESSDAFKAGYSTIADISKERIRRAGQKILEGECHENWNKDIGFRVLKIDSSNMADVYYSPDATQQDDLFGSVDNIKPGRDNPEDLLFQVMLDWAVDLTLPIRRETINDKTVLIVNDDDLVACFDLGIDEALVKELAALQPLRMVFRDNGFESDALKVNAEQIFKQLSPLTEVKAI